MAARKPGEDPAERRLLSCLPLLIILSIPRVGGSGIHAVKGWGRVWSAGGAKNGRRK
jgi:hypothetical protein